MKRIKKNLFCIILGASVISMNIAPIAAETETNTSTETKDALPYSISIENTEESTDTTETTTPIEITESIGYSTKNATTATSVDSGYQKLKINGKTSTLKRVYAKLGNIKIDSPMDGYFSGNTSMISAKEILGKTDAFDIDYTYNSSTKKVTLKRGSNTLVYTLNSKKVIYNNKTYTAPAYPRLVYNYNDKCSYVMVPGKFTAEKLGLYYKYTSSDRTAKLRIPSTTSYQTINYNNKCYTYKKRYTAVNGTVLSTPIYGFYKDNATMVSAKYSFGEAKDLDTTYKYTSSTGEIVFEHDDNTLVMKIGSTTATLNGIACTADTAPLKIYSHEKNSTYIMVPGAFVATQLGFAYAWDVDNLTANITNKDTESRSLLTPVTKLTASSSSYCVRFKRPSTVAYGTATAYDDYRNKKLYIYLNGGNYNSFVSKTANRTVKTSPSSITTGYHEAKNRTYLCIKTSSIRGFSVIEQDNYIYVRWSVPSKMFKNIVCLDAGHGGSDSGAVGNGYYEKNLTLKIVKNTKTYFDKNKNYKVYYTRLTDWYPSLTYRSDLSNSVDADMFVSVHIDAADSSSAGGTSVLYNTTSGYYQAPSSSLTSYRLASINLDKVLAVTNFTGRSDRLVLRNNLSVLRKSTTASSLIEVGFITKKSEATWINENSDKIGKAVYDSIVKTTSKYPTSK